MSDLIGYSVISVVYGVPLIASIWFLIRLLIQQLADLKSDKPFKSTELNPRVKIGFTIFGILYGMLPVFAFIIVKVLNFIEFEIKISNELLILYIGMLYMPYYCCVLATVYGLGAHGIGFGAGFPGASSSEMLRFLFPKKNKNEEEKKD